MFFIKDDIILTSLNSSIIKTQVSYLVSVQVAECRYFLKEQYFFWKKIINVVVIKERITLFKFIIFVFFENSIKVFFAEGGNI